MLKPLLVFVAWPSTQELERSVDSVKFEGFAWLWQNDETRRRLELLPGSDLEEMHGETW